jgi:hypothetical protein
MSGADHVALSESRARSIGKVQTGRAVGVQLLVSEAITRKPDVCFELAARAIKVPSM